MRSAFRRLLACLLLVLMPFQAIGASVSACACPSQMMQMMDCCDHDSDVQASDSHCGAALGCMAAPAPALPERVPAAAMPSQGGIAAATPVHFHDSFIPDGPQRPPRPLS
ncbi:hypothetical protein [Massilia genomosp. 1]|uniref:Secreted protein n=1 Tax=Massilia genomosp. 1 TaxID=2609280 RepID=A0ABX0MFD8_9BURK|nr:hypothetical protein [Massilia genomosp. 1]NHZ61516.1 hypothetical protein [Massilia genomosp. 1]